MEWSRYSFQDFIPFTADVYLNLLQRVNEAYWPLHIVNVLISITIVALVWKSRFKMASYLMIPIWLLVAFGFLYNFYNDLYWPSRWFSALFAIQALLILSTTLVWSNKTHKIGFVSTSVGLVLSALGLTWPLVSLIFGLPGGSLEWIGIHPDPTAIFTLGVLVFSQTGWRLILLMLIPSVWLMISSMTLQVLMLAQWSVVLLVIILVVLLVINKMVSQLTKGFSED